VSAHVCRICRASFEHDDPEVVAMRMRHHLGNHYATDPDGHSELAAFAPPYVDHRRLM
jgi:hypothetical protein